MEELTKYKYALGGLEAVKKGRFNEIQISDDPKKLDLEAVKDKIIQIRILGVYQESSSVFQTPEETELSDELKLSHDYFNRLCDIFSEYSIYSRFGVEDELNPTLIHIGYNPKSLDKRVVSDFLEDKIKRVVISPTASLPDFYEKNTGELGYFFQNLREIVIGCDSRESQEKTLKFLDDTIGNLREQLCEFGLTRQEYALMTIMKAMKDGAEEKENRLITNPLLIKTASEIMGLLKKLKE